MGGVLELFREEITGVYLARYVRDFNCVALYIFTNCSLVEIEMLRAFVGES
jgi:hypothetical protein